MGATFVITLREGFEAALLVGLVYTYLEQDRRPPALPLRHGGRPARGSGQRPARRRRHAVLRAPDRPRSRRDRGRRAADRGRHAHVAWVVDAAARPRAARRPGAPDRRRARSAAVLAGGRHRLRRRVPRGRGNRSVPLGAAGPGRRRRPRMGAGGRRRPGRGGGHRPRRDHLPGSAPAQRAPILHRHVGARALPGRRPVQRRSGTSSGPGRPPAGGSHLGHLRVAR